jgi:hypothetical protein
MMRRADPDGNMLVPREQFPHLGALTSRRARDLRLEKGHPWVV